MYKLYYQNTFIGNVKQDGKNNFGNIKINEKNLSEDLKIYFKVNSKSSNSNNDESKMLNRQNKDLLTVLNQSADWYLIQNDGEKIQIKSPLFAEDRIFWRLYSV